MFEVSSKKILCCYEQSIKSEPREDSEEKVLLEKSETS